MMSSSLSMQQGVEPSGVEVLGGFRGSTGRQTGRQRKRRLVKTTKLRFATRHIGHSHPASSSIHGGWVVPIK
jgi:hypothetical protein